LIPLNYLETPEMVSISSGWIAGPTFVSIAALKPLLPVVEAAHAELVHAQPAAPAETSAEVQAIYAEEKVVDVRHDHTVRALHFAALARIEHLLAEDPPAEDEAQAIADAMGRVLPIGLATTQATYLGEEGHAKQARDLVAATPTLKAALAEIYVAKKVDGGALLASWVELGSKLGDLEREKSTLLAAEGQVDATPATGTLRKARATWMAIVETVLHVLQHVSGDAADAIRRSVTEPAERAAKKARAARRAAKAAAAAPPATPKNG
jgi:hypothetical protein